MKATHWAFGLLAGCLVAIAGCKKAAQPAGQAQGFDGGKVEWLKLDTEFANSSSNVQAGVSLAKRAFRYGQFAQAIVELNKLANDPGLAESQKKVVKDLLEQTKQVIAKEPPPG